MTALLFLQLTETLFQCRSLPLSALFSMSTAEDTRAEGYGQKAPCLSSSSIGTKGNGVYQEGKRLFWLNLYVSFLYHFRLQSCSYSFSHFLSLTHTLFAPLSFFVSLRTFFFSFFLGSFVLLLLKTTPTFLHRHYLSDCTPTHPRSSKTELLADFRGLSFFCLIFHTEPFFLFPFVLFSIESREPENILKQQKRLLR